MEALQAAARVFVSARSSLSLSRRADNGGKRRLMDGLTVHSATRTQRNAHTRTKGGRERRGLRARRSREALRRDKAGQGRHGRDDGGCTRKGSSTKHQDKGPASQPIRQPSQSGPQRNRTSLRLPLSIQSTREKDAPFARTGPRPDRSCAIPGEEIRCYKLRVRGGHAGPYLPPLALDDDDDDIRCSSSSSS